MSKIFSLRLASFFITETWDKGALVKPRVSSIGYSFHCQLYKNTHKKTILHERIQNYNTQFQVCLNVNPLVFGYFWVKLSLCMTSWVKRIHGEEGICKCNSNLHCESRCYQGSLFSRKLKTT